MKKTLHSLKTKFRGSPTSKYNTKISTTEIFNSTLNAAETSIRLLKELSDTVPFLGGAASATIFIIEQCKKYFRNSQAFEDLLRSLHNLENLLSPYKKGELALSDELSARVKEFDGAISDVRVEVESLQSSSRLSQFVNNSDNETRVTDFIQAVKDAIDRIMLASLVDVSRGMQDVSRGVQDISHGVQEIALAQSLLSLNPVHSARYNCVDRDQCLNGTRVTVLDDVQKWFDVGEEQIYWLNGAAGMGKTTIALSVAHRLATNDRLLMASFFCSRESVDRKNSALIFPTLACQLASWDCEYQNALVDVLARFPYIGSALPHEQVQRLIVDPLKKLPLKTFALVIDALDECDGERATEKILLALLQHVASAPSLKVFVSCRPAAYVETLLSFGEHRRMFKLHQVPASIVDSDLRLFYHQRLEEIRVAKKIETEGWPPEALIQRLVEHAAGLFIFAVTVCKYIDSRGDVKRRLEYIANLPMSEHKEALSVDMLYTEVLSAALEKIPDERDRRDFARVLVTVMLAQESLTVDDLGKLLSIESSVIYDLLRDIHSILFVPDEHGTSIGQRVHTFHASFPDYMTAHDRVGVQVPTVYIDPAEHHSEIALCCLRYMNKELKRIIPFNDRFLGNDLEQFVSAHWAASLRYAALHWADHLSSAACASSLIPEILEELQLFTSAKLLFWLEYISLLGFTDSALGIIMKGRDWLQMDCPSSYLSTLELLQDAYHAVNELFSLFNGHAAHIYISFLLFLPQGTSLYRQYSHYLPPNWKITGRSRTTWNPLIRSIRLSPFADIFSFSPDEQSIVCTGSSIETFDVLRSRQLLISRAAPLPEQAWNIDMIPGVDADFPGQGFDSSRQPSITSTVWLSTGFIVTCCTILTAAQEPHRCHCFISLWDSGTGAHKRLLFRASEETNMFLPIITTSPDHKYLGLSIPSIQLLWDTKTWNQVSSTPSPNPFYRSFALSNKHYLIGSEVREISNELVVLANLGIDPLRVASAGFSKNSDILALALTQGLIEVWRVPSGTRLTSLQLPSFPRFMQPPLPAIAFSPTASLIAVAYGPDLHFFSLENDILQELWVYKSQYVGSMRTPVFSPGGQYIACKFENGITHVWSTAAVLGSKVVYSANELPLHEDEPSCVAFMANNRFCVTGTSGGYFSMWDCDTGLRVQTWGTSNYPRVKAVVSSSNGRYLASSRSCDASIWSFLNADAPKCEVVIPAPQETEISASYVHATNFNADGTMLAIVTGFVVDIWTVTESSGWQRLVQFRTPGVGFEDNIAIATDFNDPDFLLDAMHLDINWLACHYHMLKVSPPPHLYGKVSEDEYLQDFRSPFLWQKARKAGTPWRSHHFHWQLSFSPDNKYILAPSGIYEIATGQEIVNYRGVFRPWEHTDLLEAEVKYLQSDNKEYYKRNGMLKTLHLLEDYGWIADATGRRCFRIPQSHYEDDWPWGPWYSRASAGDRFVYLSYEGDLVFVNVPDADDDEQTQ
ncbi:hypothetical protein GYMLUDRAFT_46523 [Collybiopsis luxurians FD-317 M1]|uniref:NACHT domain-containing protein n=1 Tax=Collybiopsis luxurians FD-317 M1 TaxID=944289 RepID=A0A0D0C498_9AGAR|nr:hypothetical protein GYMLUDRAFT_46523 [Collybiopsis luxurians FD-317 M1]